MALTVGEALHGVNVVESMLETIHATIPSMDEEQLVATYQRASELGKRAWLVQAHCLWEARQRCAHHNDNALADLARQFGITQQYAGRLCGAWDAVPDEYRYSSNDLPLPKTFYNLAGQTDEPQRWAAHAEDRKAENPNYSVRDLRAEIQSARVVDTDTGEVFSGGDWSGDDNPPHDDIPGPAPTPLFSAVADALVNDGSYRDNVILEQYHATTQRLLGACSTARDIMRHVEPDAMARLLTEEDGKSYRHIAELAEWFRQVHEARGAIVNIRRIK